MEKLKLKIPNMKCVGCAATVERHLLKVGGVTDVVIDVDAKTAEITFSGDKTIKNLIFNTLIGIGYAGEEV